MIFLITSYNPTNSNFDCKIKETHQYIVCRNAESNALNNYSKIKEIRILRGSKIMSTFTGVRENNYITNNY